jgi:transposase-like protein
MRRYGEAVKTVDRRRMRPPHRQNVAHISEEIGIHMDTLYNWRKAWRLQGEVVPTSEKEPEGRPHSRCKPVLALKGQKALEKLRAVPVFAYQRPHIGSESSFYRVLHANGQVHLRGRLQQL